MPIYLWQKEGKTMLTENQYYKQETAKKQIYLHHTAGNANPLGVVSGWQSNDEHVATAYVIGGLPNKSTLWKDGDIIKAFEPKYWAYHLGLEKPTFAKFNLPYQSLDKISVGIEICNWGYLTHTDRGFTTYVNTTVKDNEVVEHVDLFKRKRYYHKYTDAQIESTRKLLIELKGVYGIDLTYHNDIWDLCPRALRGDSGVFTHNCVRTDKSDIHPQVEIIQMLKSL